MPRAAPRSRPGPRCNIVADSAARDGISVAALNDLAFAYLKQLGATKVNAEPGAPIPYEETGVVATQIPGVGVTAFSSNGGYHTFEMEANALDSVGHHAFVIDAQAMTGILYSYATDAKYRATRDARVQRAAGTLRGLPRGPEERVSAAERAGPGGALTLIHWRHHESILGIPHNASRDRGRSGGTSIRRATPKDPCALIKPAEIQSALAPGVTIGAGKPDTSMLPLGTACSLYVGTQDQWVGETSLTIAVIDMSKAHPGVSAGDLQQGLLAKAVADKANTSIISGVGDAAVFTFESRSHNGMADAFYKSKNVELLVTFHHGSALQDKDKIIALLKQAAARL